MRRVLQSLAEQTRVPDVVLVIDASAGDATRLTCEADASRFPSGTLRHRSSRRGLTLQRRVGIETLLRDSPVRYICFLDDDVVLAADFLSTVIDLMESDAGREFGGVSGYDVAHWGRPFFGSERVYHRFGFFDGDLRPGRWLYNGYFIDISHTPPSSGVVECDFISGPFIVWRSEVFERFLPPVEMKGYALMEDKHLSLRVGTRYRLAVHTEAKAWHLMAEGGRPNKLRFAFDEMRSHALLLRDCDPAPSARRYVAFLGFQLINTLAYLAKALLRLRFAESVRPIGWAAGWISCVIWPPRRTVDALSR